MYYAIDEQSTNCKTIKSTINNNLNKINNCKTNKLTMKVTNKTVTNYNKMWKTMIEHFKYFFKNATVQ